MKKMALYEKVSQTCEDASKHNQVEEQQNTVPKS